MNLEPDHPRPGRPVALVTGAGRTAGIGAGIVAQLATSGWDVAFTYWHAYDDRMPWGKQPDDTAAIRASLRQRGAASAAIEADLSTTTAPAEIFDAAQRQLGDITALVLCHCESVDSAC